MRAGEHARMFAVEDGHWWYRALRAHVADALAQWGPDGGDVLDAGCGSGANLAALGEAYEKTGCDVSAEALGYCRERGLTQLVAASTNGLPFGDGQFDVVLSCDVLCHASVRDKGAAVSELARMVQPGGLLIVNLPAYDWLKSSHDDHVGTDRRFTAGEVRRLLRSAGLSPVRVTYWNTLLFPVAALVRLYRKWRPAGRSDLGDDVGALGPPIFAVVMGIERAALGIVSLPAGLSVLAVARKA